MSRNYFFILASFLLIFQSCNRTSTDSTQNLKLWYNEPAEKWVEALPIGNGRMGAMVFGGIQTERIQLNEESV